MVTNILKILLCISLDYKLVPVLCRENEYGRLQQKDKGQRDKNAHVNATYTKLPVR